MRERRWHGGRTVPVPFRLGESTRAGFLARALVTHRARREKEKEREMPFAVSIDIGRCDIGVAVAAVAVAVACVAADATVSAVYTAR